LDAFHKIIVRNGFESVLLGMERNIIIPYDPRLRRRARELRNSSTLGEVLLWKQIKGKQLGIGFHRQVPISHFIVDFYCHEIMLAIEVDGSIHNTIQQKAKDIERQYHLEQLGVRFIRINDADVKKNMDSVIRFLKSKIKELS
jgi:very-short-patch-repair endonuclease